MKLAGNILKGTENMSPLGAPERGLCTKLHREPHDSSGRSISESRIVAAALRSPQTPRSSQRRRG
jgi:hypothetical protein